MQHYSRHYPLALPAATQCLTASVVTQTIAIECSAVKMLDFMSDAQQWLPWAMPRVQSVQPLPGGQWLLTTNRRMLKLRLRPGVGLGEFVCELSTPERGRWQLPLRMAATPTGCQLAVTFSQPAHLSLTAFKDALRDITHGLGTLKLVLEQD